VPPLPGSPTPRIKTLETGGLLIDKIYTSMEGPYERFPFDVSDLDWVTAFRTEVVDAASGEPMGDEFFCHSQVQLLNTTRLMVTATGSEDIVFPAGFGMPLTQIVGGLPPQQRVVTLLGMVLNNHVPDIDREARIRWNIEYLTNEDVGNPPRIKRLYKVGLPMTVEDLESWDPEGTTTASGGADDDAATHCVLVEGQRVHWIVPPGPQTTRRRFENIVPVNATVHYAVVHLHNHGVFMRLIDVTTGQELWRTDVRYETDRVQIEDIPAYSSAAGFPIYPDHVYEIEAFYDNPTDHDIDAMAVMDLYYHPLNDERITYPEGPSDGQLAHL
jgi:hypothetical protein